jgi:iron-sulfur cluster assembly protein
VREIVRTHPELPEVFYLSVGVAEDGSHSVALAERWDREREVCVESLGIKLIIERSQLPLLAGSVVDFKESIYGTGFLVRNANS